MRTRKSSSAPRPGWRATRAATGSAETLLATWPAATRWVGGWARRRVGGLLPCCDWVGAGGWHNGWGWVPAAAWHVWRRHSGRRVSTRRGGRRCFAHALPTLRPPWPPQIFLPAFTFRNVYGELPRGQPPRPASPLRCGTPTHPCLPAVCVLPAQQASPRTAPPPQACPLPLVVPLSAAWPWAGFPQDRPTQARIAATSDGSVAWMVHVQMECFQARPVMGYGWWRHGARMVAMHVCSCELGDAARHDGVLPGGCVALAGRGSSRRVLAHRPAAPRAPPCPW